MLPDAKMIDQFMYAAECQYGKNKAAFDKCTPISLLNCLLTCSRYGILPDGRVAHLIPYGEECTVQFDYKGLIHVVVRDGVASKVYCEAICANDQFEFRDGKVTNHVIGLPRGAVLGAYCDITLPNGEHQFEIMDVDEINSVKACSRGSNNPNSPWNKFYKEMAKKSVFRRATKWLKLTPDVMDAVNADNEGFDFEQGATSNRRSQGLFSKEVTVEVPKEEPKKTVVEVQAERVEVEARKAEASQLPF
jgi:recombination protein RecT